MHNLHATMSLLHSEAGRYLLVQSIILLIGLVLPPCFLLGIIKSHTYLHILCPPIDPSIYLFPLSLCVQSSTYCPPKPLDQLNNLPLPMFLSLYIY